MSEQELRNEIEQLKAKCERLEAFAREENATAKAHEVISTALRNRNKTLTTLLLALIEIVKQGEDDQDFMRVLQQVMQSDRGNE